MLIEKRLCSEGQADAEHTYFFFFCCPHCGETLGTSLEKANYTTCPKCLGSIEMEDTNGKK